MEYLQNQIENLQAQNQANDKNIKDLITEKKCLLSKLDEIDDEQSTNRAKIQKLEMINQEYHNEVQTLNQDIKTLRDEFEGKLAEKEESITQMEKELHATRETEQSSSNQLAEKVEIIANLTINADDLRKQCTSLNHENQAMKAEKESLLKQLEKFQADHQNTNQQQQEQQAMMDDLQCTNNKLSEQNEAKQLEITKKEQEIAEQHEKIAAFQHEISLSKTKALLH